MGRVRGHLPPSNVQRNATNRQASRMESIKSQCPEALVCSCARCCDSRPSDKKRNAICTRWFMIENASDVTVSLSLSWPLTIFWMIKGSSKEVAGSRRFDTVYTLIPIATKNIGRTCNATHLGLTTNDYHPRTKTRARRPIHTFPRREQRTRRSTNETDQTIFDRKTKQGREARPTQQSTTTLRPFGKVITLFTRVPFDDNPLSSSTRPDRPGAISELIRLRS